ncbi:hypothetical protein D9619_001264 [Psilocybe cf. subviscida]|uniref:DUF6533 domain-containing protein n=1 Tax=Psilocybe cf. subviscida TaxID=2480587 RepID=A0A8H5BIU7_9AGAR|nr:hypothetical protein D9619_001264 [Psilocybe cf. subviscida]
MEDGDWDALTSELMRQNCAFVASCSVILWDYLITFGQEVQYVWHCPSRMTRYHFLFCRYWTFGYSIAYMISGTQWTPQIPIPRKDCRTWFLIHVASVGLLYTGSQLTLIERVFNLYGKSVVLATGLFALQCIQVTGMLVLSYHISASVHFNPICNAVDIPNLTFSALAMATCVQCIMWALILRKGWRLQTGSFPKWRRYLRTSEAHAKISWGVAFAALTLNTSHSFARQRVAPVYIFTFPMTVLSIGTCRYILRIEKAKYTRAIVTDDVDEDKEDKAKGKQRVIAGQFPATRHSYSPRQPAVIPSLPCPGAPPTQNFSSESMRHSHGAVASNFPYLHDAQSYTCDRTSAAITNNSPRGSSDCSSRQTSSLRTSRSWYYGAESNTTPNSSIADSPDRETQTADTHGASDIEIGSMHSSSSIDSEDLRRFYNDTWSVGPFMTGGS